jgi:hypothetical protein
VYIMAALAGSLLIPIHATPPPLSGTWSRCISSRLSFFYILSIPPRSI